MVKIISYSGVYPNLCSGELIIEIDNKQYNLGNCLTSGGDIYFSENYTDCYVSTGDWSIDFDSVPYSFSEELKNEIVEEVNNQITHGCCGGCV